MNFLLRCLLKALAFIYILPMINGIDFHGGFVAAVALAFLFTVMLRIVEAGTLLIATCLTMATFGLALMILIPLWIFGFWVLPAIALKLVANLLPQWLTIVGWCPAILGGFVLLIIGMLTGGLSKLTRSAWKIASN